MSGSKLAIPHVLELKTDHADKSNSALNTVTWNLQNPVKGNSEKSPAQIFLDRFEFQNNLRNITDSNNILKVFTTWTNNGVFESKLITAKVPLGHYDIYTLLDYLNADNVLNGNETPSGSTLNNFTPPVGNKKRYLGLGVWGDSTSQNTTPGNNTGFPPFFIDPQFPTRVIWQGPTAGKGVLGIYDADCVYTSFNLIYDDQTKGLLDTLGLTVYANKSDNPINVSRLQFDDPITPFAYKAIQLLVYNFGTGSQYSYNPANATSVYNSSTFEQGFLPSVNSVQLQGPQVLSIEMKDLPSTHRSSYSGMTTNNVIGCVPVSAAYGNQVNWQAAHSLKACVVPQGYSIKEVHLTVRDASTGKLVDFGGANWGASIVILYVDDYTNGEEQQNYYQHPAMSNPNIPYDGLTNSGYYPTQIAHPAEPIQPAPTWQLANGQQTFTRYDMRHGKYKRQFQETSDANVRKVNKTNMTGYG